VTPSAATSRATEIVLLQVACSSFNPDEPRTYCSSLPNRHCCSRLQQPLEPISERADPHSPACLTHGSGALWDPTSVSLEDGLQSGIICRIRPKSSQRSSYSSCKICGLVNLF
jgi:hypothetical protein